MSENDFQEFMEWLKSTHDEPKEAAPSEAAPSEAAPSEASTRSSPSEFQSAAVKEEPEVKNDKQHRFDESPNPKCPECGEARNCTQSAHVRG